MKNSKFIAYDKLQKKFLYPYPHGFSILGETNTFNLIEQQVKQATPKQTFLERLGDIVILESIGNTDKNGKEIFEGHFLKFTRHPNYAMDSCLLFIVWDDTSACFSYYESNPIHGFLFPMSLSSHDELKKDVLAHCEIIGDCFTNPELLDNFSGKQFIIEKYLL